MKIKILHRVGWTVLALIIGTGVYLGFMYGRVCDRVFAQPATTHQSVLQYANEAPIPPVGDAALSDLSRVGGEFAWTEFGQPLRAYGPWTRWWWPGGAVTQTELRREVNLLADHGFAGVEIQPFTCGLDPGASPAELAAVRSYDGPAFFEKLRTALQVAQQRGMLVDLNGGAGWPLGGPFVAPEDNFLTLAYGETTVEGGQTIQIPVPPPQPALTHWMVGLVNNPLMQLPFLRDYCKPLAVVAATVKVDARSPFIWSINDPTTLDETTLRVLTPQVRDGKLRWQAPPGRWRVVSLWTMPDAEAPVFYPGEKPGLVVDHFDSTRVQACYNYLFGKRSGLPAYYGKPLRAIFNDSYEFKAERHITPDFLTEFRHRRGYDLTPYLPATLRLAYNNYLLTSYLPPAQPEFILTGADERIQYDYDLTLSELFTERFLLGSNHWLARRGLLHRTQPYGMKFDVIRGSGLADIPETETLYSGGSELFLKMVSSGALLYNRPLVSAESVVFSGRDYMTTPQKIKISVDKLLTSGINQIIFHGTPYRYKTGRYGPEGWNPWSNEVNGAGLTFSSNISETDNFWPYQRRINAYISRMQYALTRGSAQTPVLIYYPYLGIDFHETGHKELLYEGSLPSEPSLPDLSAIARTRPTSEASKWLEALWPTLQRLDALGIPWAWVNDESLQGATTHNGDLTIRHRSYPALVLANVQRIGLPTATKLTDLARQGATVEVYGKLPSQQPSFLAYQQNDRTVLALMSQLRGQPNVWQTGNGPQLAQRLRDKMPSSVQYARSYPFLSQVTRQLADGSTLMFVRNQSDRPQSFTLSVPSTAQGLYWLDPLTGLANSATSPTGTNIDPSNLGTFVGGSLAAYGSKLLLVDQTGKLRPSDLQIKQPIPDQLKGSQVVLALANWTVKGWDMGGQPLITSGVLFDWRSRDDWKFTAHPADYTTEFTLPPSKSGEDYLLNLGQVCDVAEVTLNNHPVGNTLFAPHTLNLTQALRAGRNTLRIRIVSTQRNGYIGQALHGDKVRYGRFAKRAETLMPAGLFGPVTLCRVNRKLPL